MCDKSRVRLFLPIVLSVMFLFSLVSCGGGGGGGSSPTLSYSGATTQALVTEDNAGELISTAVAAGVVSSTLSDPIAATTEPLTIRVSPQRLLTLNDIRRTIEELDVRRYQNDEPSGAIVSRDETVYGGCGGFADLSLDYDDRTGYFDGTMSFHDYCEEGEVINGSLDFSGSLDIYSGDFITFSMDIGILTSVSDTESFTMSGQAEIDVIDLSTIELTLNLLIRNDDSNNVFRLSDYAYRAGDSGSEFTFEISGRFYHPDYGYTEIATPVPFRIGYYDDYPYTGQLLLVGADATAALLTAHNASEYEISVDSDGNGTYETTTGILPWSSF
jgi:hypothetical protein